VKTQVSYALEQALIEINGEDMSQLRTRTGLDRTRNDQQFSKIKRLYITTKDKKLPPPPPPQSMGLIEYKLPPYGTMTSSSSSSSRKREKLHFPGPGS
jgi:hypothetical protein